MGKGSGCCTRGRGAEECRAVPESCGLDESSEDSDDRDHAVPFSNSSCRLSIFWERGKNTQNHAREPQGMAELALGWDSHKRPAPEERVCLEGFGYRWRSA